MTEYLVGLDLGQSIDYTALAVAEVVSVLTGERGAVPGVIGQSRTGAVVPITRPKTEKQFHVRHLARFELGTRYPRMVDDVAALLNREPLKSADVTLLLDRTGIGRPVSDLFELADLNCTLVPVGIHGGDHETRDGADEAETQFFGVGRLFG